MDKNQQIAKKFDLPILKEIHDFEFVQKQTAIIPYLFAKQKQILPLEQNGDEVTVAIADPLDVEALQELGLYLKKRIRSVYCSIDVIEAAIERCYHQKEEETKKLFTDLEKGPEEGKGNAEEYDLLEQSDENPIVRMVNAILLEGIQQDASDIHLEPKEEGLVIRYRIDGCLQNRHTPPREYQVQMLTRIKVMARLDIAEHRLPQDGRIKLRQGGREIDFRVSTLPTVYGERIVLRILDKGNVVLGIQHIGMNQKISQQFHNLLQTPEGIVLVTGPTGSGKTTTLYSGVAEINHQETNIITIEDPIEYKIPGISQMNVNPKIELSFARGLRHILRQDPDIIMIGEIRDRETAEIAIQASLTGHLVLSTLHTNDAPSALTRLSDMGIEPYLLASSVLGVIAQRLVRKICPTCKEKYLPTERELFDLNLEAEVPLYRGSGCSNCFHTGYKKRHAIYELMMMSPKIQMQVMKSQGASELCKMAIEEGMKTLFDQGVELVLEGITTSTELLRVTKTKTKGGDRASF